MFLLSFNATYSHVLKISMWTSLGEDVILFTTIEVMFHVLLFIAGMKKILFIFVFLTTIIHLTKV